MSNFYLRSFMVYCDKHMQYWWYILLVLTLLDDAAISVRLSRLFVVNYDADPRTISARAVSTRRDMSGSPNHDESDIRRRDTTSRFPNDPHPAISARAERRTLRDMTMFPNHDYAHIGRRDTTDRFPNDPHPAISARAERRTRRASIFPNRHDYAGGISERTAERTGRDTSMFPNQQTSVRTERNQDVVRGLPDQCQRMSMSSSRSSSFEEMVTEGIQQINRRLAAVERASQSFRDVQQNSNPVHVTTAPSVRMTRAAWSSSTATGGRDLIGGSGGSEEGPHSVYEEHRRLFGYQPSVSGVLGSGKRKGKCLSDKGPRKRSRPLCTWKKEVACLRFSDTVRVPDTREKMVMAQMGLGFREMIFDLNGDELYLHTELLAEFPALKSTGGYSLLRPNTNSYDLVVIEVPQGKGGINIRYLKDVLRSARLYVRPLQFSIESLDEDEYDYDVKVTTMACS